MLDRAGMAHKGSQRVTYRRMAGITGLGGHHQIGQPQGGNGDMEPGQGLSLLGPQGPAMEEKKGVEQQKARQQKGRQSGGPEGTIRNTAAQFPRPIRWPPRNSATRSLLISLKRKIFSPLWSLRKVLAFSSESRGMNSWPIGPWTPLPIT